jgi:DNA-binding MarR family transcriptional regulator
LNNHTISEKEFEIINVLADGLRANQRELSNHLGVSLGMTNLLLRRLVTKGYLRIQQLNRKKVQYLLTPSGLSEKAKKSYRYTVKTIESFGLLKDGIRKMINEHLTHEIHRVLVMGEGDLAELVEMALRDSRGFDVAIERIRNIPAHTGSDTLLLNTSQKAIAGMNGHIHCLDVLVSLANNLDLKYLLSSRRSIEP